MNLNFLKHPFIPENHVKLMLVDGRTPEHILCKLSSFGIDLILTDPCNSVYPSISCHPDIQLHSLGNGNIVASPNMFENIKNKLSKYSFNIICGHSVLKSNYPEDIAYNIARIGNICFHKLDCTDPIVKKNLVVNGLTLVNVNQGYTKCSTAIISNSAIITSDKGIHKAALQNGIDSLLIVPGYIHLKDLNYGFIGGCTGLIAPGVLVTTGSLESHPEFKKVLEFLNKHKVEMISLTSSIPIDIGSLIPLLEVE